MKKTLCLMVIFITSTVTFAGETSTKLQNPEPVVLAPTSNEKPKASLIKQSVKKANLSEEVDTQALKLGGIHRRDDAREYLKLKDEVEQDIQTPIDKNKVKDVTAEKPHK